LLDRLHIHIALKLPYAAHVYGNKLGLLLAWIFYVVVMDSLPITSGFNCLMARL